MRPGGGKKKGKSYEEKIAKILHSWHLENCPEYKELFESVGNDELRPQRDRSSGVDLGSHGDINLNLLKKWFPYSVECKHWASLDISLNPLLKGKITSLIAVWKTQAVPKAKKTGLTPLVVFSANRTEVFIMTKRDPKLLIKLVGMEKNFVVSYKYVICTLADFLDISTPPL